MTDKQKESCYQIAEKYGRDSQVDKAIEEMSELTKALLKRRRNEGFMFDIMDELADVSIMVEQLIYIYGLSSAVNERIDYKLDRQKERMKQDGGC